MKKPYLIILLTIIISCLIACQQVDRSSESISTTAVTNEYGVTKYYEVLSDNDTTVYAEIETHSNGKVVIDNKGHYVTNQNTTVKTSSNDSQNNNEHDDNDVVFDASNSRASESESTTNDEKQSTTSKNNTTNPSSTTNTSANERTTKAEETDTTATTEQTTESPTDEDGWINRWY